MASQAMLHLNQRGQYLYFRRKLNETSTKQTLAVCSYYLISSLKRVRSHFLVCPRLICINIPTDRSCRSTNLKLGDHILHISTVTIIKNATSSKERPRETRVYHPNWNDCDLFSTSFFPWSAGGLPFEVCLDFSEISPSSARPPSKAHNRQLL